MRLTQNKARATENNAPSVGTLEPMNEVFQKVMDAAAAVQNEAPQTRAEYVQGIIDAQDAQKAAQAAKDEAETGSDFDKACDDATRAREKEVFFRRKLDALDFTPRMDDAEYDGLVKSVAEVMAGAADTFRKTLIDSLLKVSAAKKEYDAMTAAADSVLEALDNATNVLQCRHRHRILELKDQDPIKIEDRFEWEHYRTRYSSGESLKMIIDGQPEKQRIAMGKVLEAADIVNQKAAPLHYAL